MDQIADTGRQGGIVDHEEKYAPPVLATPADGGTSRQRAFVPDRFRTPGSKVNVNTGNQFTGDNLIIDTPVMLRLQEMRQESLRKIKEKMAQATAIASNDAMPLGTGPPAGVPPAT